MLPQSATRRSADGSRTSRARPRSRAAPPFLDMPPIAHERCRDATIRRSHGGRAMGMRVSALTVVVAATAGVGVSVALTRIPTAAAADKPTFKVTRTSWGDPDLQGVWDYRTITPMERRPELGDRE